MAHNRKVDVVYYQGESDDTTYDDACDFGQFFLNPCWFLFVKLQSCVRRCFRRQQAQGLEDDCGASTRAPSERTISSSPRSSSSWIHMQRPLYLVFLIGGWTMIFTIFYPVAWRSHDVADKHCYMGYLVFVACIVSWRYASTTSPGTITADTMWKFDNYEYDNLLYKHNSFCPTLHLRKLARSKYDRYTHRHIPKFDHYCGWLQQSIGEENYLLFLAFVAVHAAMCTYGAVLNMMLLKEIVAGNDNNEQRLQQLVPGPTTEYTRYGLMAIMCFLSMASIPLVGFFSFHMYLIAKGMTTNEYYKWKLVRSRHDKATAAYSNRHKWEQDDEHAALLTVQERTIPTDPGPSPINLYDCGIRANFLEVLYPRSLENARRRKRQ